MIDVAELRSLIKHEQQPLTDIEQIFRALIGYPNEEDIANSTRAEREGALEAACDSLIGDERALPPATLQIIRDALDSVSDEGLAAPTYVAAVEAIKANPAPFLKRARGDE